MDYFIIREDFSLSDPLLPPSGSLPIESSAQDLRYAEDLAKLTQQANSLSQRIAAASGPLCILLADDDDHVRAMLAATLAHRKYEILQARSGPEALALTQARHPHLVLLDVHMPGFNGFEVCHAIRADPELAETIVIMVTGASHPTDVQQGQSAGANAYLTKPYSPSQLLQVMDSLLAR
jgi:CheY-like chemotaxis protein